MKFNPNKTPIEVIREGAFGGTYFRDIYSGINGVWYKSSWKEFVQIKNIDTRFYAWDYYDVNVNKYGVKSGTSLRFWEKSKERIHLMSVIVDQIVVSDKFKYNKEGFKYFIGYQEGEIVKPLCIILPQMKTGEKACRFWLKMTKHGKNMKKIWDVIKSKLGIKFHSEPVYDKTYIKN